MNKNNWGKIKCYLKKEWHKLIARAMVGVMIAACLWTVSKTANIIAFANDLPDTLQTIHATDSTQNVRLDKLDSLFAIVVDANKTDSTAQKKIFDSLEELKNLLTTGENP